MPLYRNKVILSTEHRQDIVAMRRKLIENFEQEQKIQKDAIDYLIQKYNKDKFKNPDGSIDWNKFLKWEYREDRVSNAEIELARWIMIYRAQERDFLENRMGTTSYPAEVNFMASPTSANKKYEAAKNRTEETDAASGIVNDLSSAKFVEDNVLGIALDTKNRRMAEEILKNMGKYDMEISSKCLTERDVFNIYKLGLAHLIEDSEDPKIKAWIETSKYYEDLKDYKESIGFFQRVNEAFWGGLGSIAGGVLRAPIGIGTDLYRIGQNGAEIYRADQDLTKRRKQLEKAYANKTKDSDYHAQKKELDKLNSELNRQRLSQVGSFFATFTINPLVRLAQGIYMGVFGAIYNGFIAMVSRESDLPTGNATSTMYSRFMVEGLGLEAGRSYRNAERLKNMDKARLRTALNKIERPIRSLERREYRLSGDIRRSESRIAREKGRKEYYEKRNNPLTVKEIDIAIQKEERNLKDLKSKYDAVTKKLKEFKKEEATFTQQYNPYRVKGVITQENPEAYKRYVKEHYKTSSVIPRFEDESQGRSQLEYFMKKGELPPEFGYVVPAQKVGTTAAKRDAAAAQSAAKLAMPEPSAPPAPASSHDALFGQVASAPVKPARPPRPSKESVAAHLAKRPAMPPKMPATPPPKLPAFVLEQNRRKSEEERLANPENPKVEDDTPNKSRPS